MPLPAFNIDGVMPPYVGPDGPGGAPEDMSPYVVTSAEVVTTLGTSAIRRTILRGWLYHRAALRAVGFVRGFQWLDGSFVEDKEPQDLDVVSFTRRPNGISDPGALLRLLQANVNIFQRPLVKAAFHVDFFPIDLDGSPEGVVNLTRYWLGLFSHRRVDDLWKGMLQVRLEDMNDDKAALNLLGLEPGAAPLAGGV